MKCVIDAFVEDLIRAHSIRESAFASDHLNADFASKIEYLVKHYGDLTLSDVRPLVDALVKLRGF